MQHQATAAQPRAVDAGSFRRLTDALKRMDGTKAAMAQLEQFHASVALLAALTPVIPAVPPPQIAEPSPPEAVIAETASPAEKDAEITDAESVAEQSAASSSEPVASSADEIAAEPPIPQQPRQSHLRRVASEFASEAPTMELPELTPEQQAQKNELARSLIDMMASSASSGQPQERALAADTLLRLLPQLPTTSRIAIAERVALMDTPPVGLISRLIVDSDLRVVAPLIEDCMHLAEEDLFAIVQSGNREKKRLIARRRRISAPIAEALANSPDHSVLLTLVRNQGAEIPPEGFAAIMAQAQDNPELLAPLCTRQDLPVHLAFELFWFAPAQLRRYLLTRFLTESETLTKILKIAQGASSEASYTEPRLATESIVNMINDLRGEEAEAVEEQIATTAQIHAITVRRILADKRGEPLMALLKVLGLPRSALEVLLPELATGNNPLIDPSRNIDEVQSVFDQFSFNKARILLTYWDWATLRSGPYAKTH